jgi:hypothetical protein
MSGGPVSMKCYEAPIADLPELLSTDESGPNATSQDRSAGNQRAGNQRVRMQPVQRLLHNRRPHSDIGRLVWDAWHGENAGGTARARDSALIWLVRMSV